MNDFDGLIAVVFLFGALWGSFANVVVSRLPENKSVILPRSHCPKCKYLIPWYLNIPLFSWLLLKGRCKNCGVNIPFRYFLLEFLMGFFFAAFYQRYGISFLTLEYFIFCFGLITASFIDFDHMILPDEFTLSGIVIGLAGAALNPERVFMDSLLGVLLGGGFLLSVAYFYLIVRKIDGMGGGDIKLIAWIGAVCGYQSILFVIVVSNFLGIFFAIFYMIKSKAGLKAGIPFGPYLSMAALIYLLFDVQDFFSSLLFPI